jgi:hypothetical protein
MNRLIVIGWGMGPHAGPNANRGVKRCYLNISREEAVRRYLGTTEEHPYISPLLPIEELVFDDHFDVFDVWGLHDKPVPDITANVSALLLKQQKGQ